MMSVGNVYKQGKCSKIKIQKREQLKWMKVDNYMINLTMSEHIWHQRQNSLINNYIQIDINVKLTIQE